MMKSLDTQKLIYIADDEKHIRDLMRKTLEKEGYLVKTFENGELLLAEFQTKRADLVILDVMMDGADGISICCMLRQISTVPIIIVSARGSETDKVTGISIGCDDYLTKPFSLLEMTVRVKALFRRASYQADTERTVLIIGNMTVDHNLRKITCAGAPFTVTQTEFSFLEYLIKNRHRAVSREELLRKLWDFGNGETTTRATDDTVKRIRLKLTAAGADVRIQTVRGFGFTIEEINNESKKDVTS